METLTNGITLDIPSGCFPLSTDSVVLAHFVRLPKNARVLDLGAGCATLGLLLCARDPGCTVTGVEIDEVAHLAALDNIRRNGLDVRLNSVCCDLRTFAPEPGSFHVCVSNPPYFSGGPASKCNPLARRDDCCTPEELLHSAAGALKFGGDFYLVHKPEKLAQLIACGAQAGLEAKELTLVRHNEGSPVSMVLLKFRKGAKCGLILHERCLFDSQGRMSPYYREVYHIKGD